MGDIRVGDLVRVACSGSRRHGRVGIVRRVYMAGILSVEFERGLSLHVFAAAEVTAVKRDGQWLTLRNGRWTS